LVDRISDALMAEAVRQGTDQRFTEGMDRVSDVHFVNLLVGARAKVNSVPLHQAAGI
jgi:hypothetical protein